MFATIMTTLTFAALPWGIAQLAILWQPKLQHDHRHRRNFRRITALVAIAATVPTPFGWPWLWLGAIAGAVALDVQWYRFAHTGNGAKQLQEAKAHRKAVREGVAI